jgi:predicted GNAT family acetyltransferase
MTRLFKLYKKTINDLDLTPIIGFSDFGYSILIFKPTLLRLGVDNSEMIKKFLWYFITMGRYRILYIMEDKKVVHYSFIIPKNFRFPFIGPDDLEIGPCFTENNYRGRGIYTRVLQMIPQIFKDSARTFWIYTLQNNNISQRAIEKAGYNSCGLARNTKVLRILKQV